MRKRVKAVRINPKRSTMQFGRFDATQILNAFRQQEGERVASSIGRLRSTRLFAVPTSRPQYFITGLFTQSDNTTYQLTYRVFAAKGKLSFECIGDTGDPDFHRQIHDPFYRGRGIGTKALKQWLALEKEKGKGRYQINTAQKSTLLMLLKSGFKLTEKEKLRLHKEGLNISTEAQLAEIIRKAKGNSFTHTINLQKHLN